MTKLIQMVQTYGHEVLVTIAVGVFLYGTLQAMVSYLNQQPQYRKSHPVPVGGSTDHC